MSLQGGLIKVSLFLAICTAFAPASRAGESAATLVSAGMPRQCGAFAAMVSKSEGVFKSRNQFNCLGAFQFCPGTFERYYSGTADEFLGDSRGQVTAWISFQKDEWKKAEKYGLTSLIGEQVCSGNTCKTIDRSAILMACQFGCGPLGKLAKYKKTGDCDARSVKDGNGVSVCSYLVKGAGYDASCLTGNPAAVTPRPIPIATPPVVLPPSPEQPKLTEAANIVEIGIGKFTIRFSKDVKPSEIEPFLELVKRHSGQ